VNLYIASSPLQLLNCIEARDRFHANEENHLFFIYKKSIDLEQAKPLLKHGWTSRKFFKWTKLSRLFYGVMLRSYLSRVKGARNLYLGYPYNIRAHIANSTASNVWVVDDGNYSVWLADQLENADSGIWRRPSLADRLLGRRVSTEYLREAKFFTIYPVLERSSHLSVINDFQCVRANLANMEETEEVIFIGSPVVGNLVQFSSQFVELMAEVSKYYNYQRVSYVAHRYEDVDELKDLLGGLNFEIKRFATLIEMQFMIDEQKPRALASFTSSALVNLNLIYDVPVVAFQVPDSWIPKNKRDIYGAVYKQLQKDGIPLARFEKG